jgi:hypothetical protein
MNAHEIVIHREQRYRMRVVSSRKRWSTECGSANRGPDAHHRRPCRNLLGNDDREFPRRRDRRLDAELGALGRIDRRASVGHETSYAEYALIAASGASAPPFGRRESCETPPHGA